MTIDEVKSILEAEVIGDGVPGAVVLRACACDLLSNVLRCITGEKGILLTNLTNLQTVRVAEMVDATAICFMHGKIPESDTVKLARQKGIVLLSTTCTTYEASGRLYRGGLPSCGHE